jgi:hypothetical protein
MLIRIDDHTHVEDLCAHFRRSGFQADSVGGAMVEVARPDARTHDQEHREVDMHLRVWKLTNPEAPVELI